LGGRRRSWPGYSGDKIPDALISIQSPFFLYPKSCGTFGILSPSKQRFGTIRSIQSPAGHLEFTSIETAFRDGRQAGTGKNPFQIPKGLDTVKKGKGVGRGAARLNGINRSWPGSRSYSRMPSLQSCQASGSLDETRRGEGARLFVFQPLPFFLLRNIQIILR